MTRRTITALSEREQVRGVAAAWRERYPLAKDSQRGGLGGFREDVYEKLCALDPETATADDVAAIIGNRSWVCAQTCHQCGRENWDAVWLGQEHGYETHNAIVCRECLIKEKTEP